MKTQQKKQNQKRSKHKTKSSPREEVIRWVKEFVEVPHPMFADYPPCPYAKQARLAGKVDFVELTDMEPDSNIWCNIDHFDFDNKDVLVIIADAKRWTAHYTQKLAAQLNGTYAHKDLLIMEDHPGLVEKVKDVKMNQGKYTLLLVQSRTKLKRFADILDKSDYYKNWSTKYRESVTGTWRHPVKSRP
jgi:predicted nuclease of restriction endonuclease-like RecB superfamily